ncbi:autophagy-related 8 atg8 [Babesia ovata]|uniref:Autophagy-related protein n=1 Tax=Babesia ovata TaxID=189622 RepID=A0A2H6K7J7_9APIC|nr:autophagy-related 8 atg8 [Babesia ovata]GBE58971.1 autophagy-related 8 atg8 [Babesia ovata]
MAERTEPDSPDSLAGRQSEIANLRARFHNRIPVICVAKKFSTLHIDKSKFLVPANMMYAEFKYILQKHLVAENIEKPERVGKNVALYLYVGGIIPMAQALMGELFQKHQSEEGVLYMTYANENTLG